MNCLVQVKGGINLNPGDLSLAAKKKNYRKTAENSHGWQKAVILLSRGWINQDLDNRIVVSQVVDSSLLASWTFRAFPVGSMFYLHTS